MAYDEARPVWWVWVTMDPFLLGVMVVGFGRILAQHPSLQDALISLVFFAALALVGRGHRSSWQRRPSRYSLTSQLLLAIGCFMLGVVVVLAAFVSEGVSIG